MPAVFRARWIAWSTVLILTVASAIVVAGSAAVISRATQAVATPVNAWELKDEGA